MEKIRINVADSATLQQLYRVGPVLAEKIVESRVRHGLFTSPADLARVEGVSLSLATTIAQQIDWSVDEELKKSEQTSGSFFVVLLVLLPAIVLWFRTVYDVLQEFVYGSSSTVISMWINGSIVITNVALFLFFLIWLVEPLLKSRMIRRRLVRAMFFSAGVTLFGIVSTGIGNAVYFTFLSAVGWSGFDLPRLLGLGGLAMVTSMLLPLFLGYVFPRNAYQVFWARFFDIHLFVGGAFTALGGAMQDDVPLWLSLYMLMFGLLILTVGAMFLRGASPYSIFLERLQALRTDEGVTVWMSWVNEHLPDVDQQRALLAALQHAYPASRLRTLGGAVLIGGAIWVIATTCAAIAEWVIQGYLDATVPLFP